MELVDVRVQLFLEELDALAVLGGLGVAVEDRGAFMTERRSDTGF